jgi:hypothetical protein
VIAERISVDATSAARAGLQTWRRASAGELSFNPSSAWESAAEPTGNEIRSGRLPDLRLPVDSTEAVVRVDSLLQPLYGGSQDEQNRTVMATTALNSWNAIKTRHEALSKDAKFKPDSLAPLCARLDDYGTQLAKQQDEKEKAGKVIDDAGDAFTACSKKIADKYDEIKQLTEQMAEAGMGEEDLTGDDAVKIVSKAAASFVNLAKELAEVAQAIAKASDEQAGIVKKMAEQFKAKREAVDNAIKRIQAEGSKTQDQIRKQVDVYRKTAIGMKDTGMAGDIGSLNSVVAQLYSFQ